MRILGWTSRDAVHPLDAGLLANLPEVPELDFAVICDYVRVDASGGCAHVIGGGIDTIYADSVPTGRNVGLWARARFAQAECGRPHRIEIFVQDLDGSRVAEIEGTVRPEWPENYPTGWKVGVGMAYNLGLPLPSYGQYAFELLINDSLVKSIPFLVVQSSDA